MCRPRLKRDSILDAARECFLEAGYAATSMDAIAARTPASKVTLYRYFNSKLDLFAAVIRHHGERDHCLLNAWPIDGDTRTRLTATGLILLNLLLSPDTLGLYRVAVAEAARHPELASVFWDIGPGFGQERLSAVFGELAQQGDLTVPDPRIAAEQFSAMLRGEVFHRALLGLPLPDSSDAGATVAAAVDTLLRAYGGPPV